MKRTKPGRANPRREVRGSPGISRRAFLGAAVAVGTASALGLVLERRRSRAARGLSLHEADYYRRDGLAG